MQQAEYAASKASKAACKVNRLIDGRDGVSLKTGIELYKTLVRPCWEFSFASWATMPESGISLLEKVQARCLRKILGAKCHASGDAVDVIAGVMPVRLRIQQLCSLEFVRLLQTSETSKACGGKFAVQTGFHATALPALSSKAHIQRHSRGPSIARSIVTSH